MSILIWTTPHMRAERALLDAGQHLTFGRIPQARAKVQEMLAEVRELVRAIDEAEAHSLEIYRKQVEHQLWQA